MLPSISLFTPAQWAHVNMVAAPHEWVRDQRLDRGLLQVDIEEKTAALGHRVSQSHLSKIEKGRSPLAGLGAEKLNALREVLGVSTEEWAQRTGLSVVLSTSPLTNRNISHRPELTGLESSSYIMKHVYGLAEASRPVSEMEPLREGSPIAVERARLRSQTELFQVSGDSMRIGEYGGILPGDVVFVDVADRDATPDRVYVIAIAGQGVCIKRVRELGGQLWLFSDNPDQANYPPFQADDARIIGRVHDLTRRPDVRL